MAFYALSLPCFCMSGCAMIEKTMRADEGIDFENEARKRGSGGAAIAA